MSEKQNEVVTEKFIADFALIDASVVQKKSAWDIANENPTYSFVAFFWKDKILYFIPIETSSDLLKYLFLTASIPKSSSLTDETTLIICEITSLISETTLLIWKWMLIFVSLWLVKNKYPSNASHIFWIVK